MLVDMMHDMVIDHEIWKLGYIGGNSWVIVRTNVLLDMKKQTKSDTTKRSVPNKNNMSVMKSGGEVATKRVDSIKKANPQLGRAIGKPGIGSGGMKTYGDGASDAIKAGLKGSAKKK